MSVFEHTISDYVGVNVEIVGEFFRELKTDACFHGHLGECFGLVDRYLGQMVNAEVLYVLCRYLVPAVVVETGIGSGFSSYHILRAIQRNRFGRLWSIDKPNWEDELRKTSKEYAEFDVSSGNVPDGRETGWLVPEYLRRRWLIVVGLSKDKLEPLLQEIRVFDIFVHDSEHSYENMLFELETVWPFLRRGGFIFMDDVSWSPAFEEFVATHGEEVRSVMLGERTGILRRLV